MDVRASNGGRMSEVILVHSNLANYYDDADRNWTYFIGRLVEHCEKR